MSSLEQPVTNNVVCMSGIRTNLRPVRVETDLPLLLRAVNDLSITQYLHVQPPITEAKERAFLENIGLDDKSIIFALEDKGSQEFIGLMSIVRIDWKTRMASTGTIIANKDFWSKGHGYDAKMQLLNFAFKELNLHRINSSVVGFNKRSANCLLKCGYKQEGIRRKYYYRNGKYVDQIVFGILAEDFRPVWRAYSEELKAANKA